MQCDACMTWKNVVDLARRLDKHGIGTQALPEEAGVPTLLDALDPASAGWPHSVAAMEVGFEPSSERVRILTSLHGSFIWTWP